MYIVIMAGGSGTRFWPLSRSHRPKQLLSLFGDRPMIAETVERFTSFVPRERILVVTSEALRPSVLEALPQLPAENVLAEPLPRNTAPCVGFAALAVRQRSGEDGTVMGVFPADHYIRDVDSFVASVKKAEDRAKCGAIVTLGVEPTHPETGYGYIRRGDRVAEGSHAVSAFVEKPDRTRALRYLSDGAYLWNAGIFAFRVDTILGELERQMPQLYAQLEEMDSALRTDDAAELLRIFQQVTPESIDYGVMEGAEQVEVIGATFGWSDVGHWDALPDVKDTDDRGNVAIGDVVALDCEHSVLVGHDSRVLAAVGLSHIVVVDTEDAVLVAPRDRVQEVRAIVSSLKTREGDLT